MNPSSIAIDIKFHSGSDFQPLFLQTCPAVRTMSAMESNPSQFAVPFPKSYGRFPNFTLARSARFQWPYSARLIIDTLRDE